MRRGSNAAHVRDQNCQAEDRQQGARYQMSYTALLIRAVAEESVTQINAEGAGEGH